MDDTEATAIQAPPPVEIAEVPAVPAPDAVPETPAPETAETPGPPAEPEETPPDPRDELEHERFKPHLERIRRQEATRVRQEEATTRQEAQVSVDAKEVIQNIQNVYGNIAQKLGDADSEAVERLLPRLEAAAAPFVEAEKKKLRGEGNKEGQAELHQGILAAVQQSLGQRSWEDMEDYYTKESGLTWADILNRYHELRSGKWKAEKTTLEAQIESLKAKARPDGADDAPKDGGGGKLYKDYTPEERRGMSSDEIDAMQARERER